MQTTTTIDTSLVQFARRRRVALGGAFQWKDMDDDVAYTETARDVLDADTGDAELSLIAKDVDEQGYISLGQIATVLTWLADQSNQSTLTFKRTVSRCQRCHRELKDAESMARGYGPECWGRKGVAA